jgi:hypothetical protein
MKDTDKRTLRSILLTLSLQDYGTTLPDSLTTVFQSFARTPNTSVMELHRAIVETPLSTTYQSIRTWLSGLAAEQGLGWDFPPADEDDEEPIEQGNIARDTQASNQRLKEMLTKIDANLDNANQILAADNPIQAVHQLGRSN